jgi:cell division transport system ATP-binding protein
MIQYKHVAKSYPNGAESLKDVNLSVGDGEFIFLVGPSGAGKTSLFKMLLREEMPTSGEVWLNDIEVHRLKDKQVPKLRRNIGMVFQDFRVLSRLTVWENVAFALEVVGKADADIAKVVPYMLTLVGLKDKAHSFPHQLSGGEQQRIAIARALVHEPSVLLADEPTGNLDPETSWEIVELLSQINGWGTTVVMATHNQDIVNALKKRVVTMNKGTIVKDEAEGTYQLT